LGELKICGERLKALSIKLRIKNLELRTKIFFFVILILVVMGGAGWWFMRGEDGGILSPLGMKKQENGLKIVGFLPTWMVGKTKIYGEELDRLVFLGVEVNEKGDLVWDVQGKKINNPDYLKIKEEIKKTGGENILGVKLFKDEKLKKLMASSEARGRLVEQVMAAVEAGNFDGVNLDFEYQYDPLAVTEEVFLGLIAEMRGAGIENISLDVFANTIIKSGYERLFKLVGAVDEVLVMAYDFHASGSSSAGPVAPLGAPTGERSILEVLEKIESSGVDKNKITIALPLYGYQWKTETTELGSPATDYVAMLTYAKMGEFLQSDEFLGRVNQNWDELSATPWIWLKKQETVSWKERVKVGKVWKTVAKSKQVEVIHQVYYEDQRSLMEKIKAIREAGINSIGFWALGYEGETNLLGTIRNDQNDN
jgi:spore germination protein YaaH